MVVCDVFIVSTETASISAESLRQKMDLMAPSPWHGVGPNGSALCIFAVDFHKAPDRVCARYGFQYSRVGLMDVMDVDYSPLNIVQFNRYNWVMAFFLAWKRETTTPQ